MDHELKTPQLYLASQSPRRAELLRQVGIRFDCVSAPVDETLAPGEAAEHYVQRLAEAKAKAGWKQVLAQQLPELPVLGADTSVVLDGAVLGKPVDRADGLAMLAALSGRSHQVMTAVCLYSHDVRQLALSVSEVTFRHLSLDECEHYWQTGEPADKAGGYAIQGRAAIFIEQLQGSYSGVVGLPLLETWQLLEDYERRHPPGVAQLAMSRLHDDKPA